MIDIVHGGSRLGDGEQLRIEIHHPPERISTPENEAHDASFIRLVRTEEHPGSILLTVFAESDPPGAPRIYMNLWPDLLDELIQALTEMKGGES